MTTPTPPHANASSCVYLRDLIARHRTQAEAAKAWGVSQSAVSRLLRGERGIRNSEALRSIAKAEGYEPAQIMNEQPDLRLHHGATDSRFLYSLDNPESMRAQLEDWFADLPTGTRMARQAVRAVIRVLFDESFDSIHTPGPEWHRVMKRVYGIAEVDNLRRTRDA